LKAVSKIEPKPGIVIQEVEEPKIGPTHVLVEIKATAICGSDLHIYRCDEQATRWKPPLPMTVGLEFSGEVVEVGKEVRSIRWRNPTCCECRIGAEEKPSSCSVI